LVKRRVAGACDPHVDPEPPAMAAELKDVGRRSRHHLMQARRRVRRLRERAKEIQAERSQHRDRLRDVLGQDAPKLGVIIDPHGGTNAIKVERVGLR
jgi:hypothetical protein